MTPTVARFAELFRGRENCYGVYLETPDQPKQISTAKGVTPEASWINHLAGEGPYLGQMPLRQDNTCFFGAIDADDEGTDHRALAVAIEALALPLVVCRSKSGGAHLYLFMAEAVSGKTLVAKLKQFAAALHLEKNHDDRPIEIFPKQTRLRADAVGNWINLPYYNCENTTRFAVTQEGKQLMLDDFLLLAESKRLTVAELEATHPRGADPFHEGPPCLKTLHGLGYSSGMRNQGMYNVGIYMRLAHPDDWQKRMQDYNGEKMNPPMSTQEIQQVITSLERGRDYTYKCKEAPIAPHCQAKLCRTQKFGIGSFAKAKVDAMFPKLEALTKIETDPPRWTVTVNGKIVEVDTEDLLSLQRFRKTALERAMVIIPTIKQPEWDDKIRELMSDITIVPAPEDAGVVGQFRALVRQFLETRKYAETKDDIVAGRPYTEGGKIYFRSTDLTKYLVKNGFREYEPSEIFTVLRRIMNAEDDRLRIKGQQVRVWIVPAPKDDIEKLDVATTQSKAY